MNDDVLNVVRDSMSGVRMGTPARDVISAGRARRRRRLAATAGGVLAAAVAWTLTVYGQQVNGPPTVHVQMAAFSVDSNADGTVTVRLTKQESLDPATMENALAQAGIPAQVTVNKWCDTAEGSDEEGFQRVVGTETSDGLKRMVITPSAMPEGTKLLIGIRTPDYQPDNPNPLGATMGLVQDDAPQTCTTDIPTKSAEKPSTADDDAAKAAKLAKLAEEKAGTAGETGDKPIVSEH
ncbi:hypothetical protein Acor_72460 [Acrocarpospora corrugata]|uniref:Uncharacterized protein n=1 Tax=Acrocarpospora corrugata TaxID=35763 RepID=A0A5M3WFL8_9ACTN|nr:hypothetical protein [Acrocarpospora corrugata]GES05178.1 hypothetical protein Acor_72460 [Acrocarpospora corrugata]